MLQISLTGLVDYAHRINPETPIEETMRALAQLQSSVHSSVIILEY